jgi:RNA polymerase sigma-70 factor (ECF subfamily)
VWGDANAIMTLAAAARPDAPRRTNLARAGYHFRSSNEQKALGTQPPRSDDVARETTGILLGRARAGDEQALEALFRRCVGPLRRWARGRLPGAARHLADTEDLVQDTVLGVFRRLGSFELRHAGALQAYLRQALMNRLRDHVRRIRRQPPGLELSDSHPDDGPSALERAIGRQNVARYEAALARLRPNEREAIVGRLEMAYDYRELADLLDLSSPDAARMAVKRALQRLVEEMRRGS